MDSELQRAVRDLRRQVARDPLDMGLRLVLSDAMEESGDLPAALDHRAVAAMLAANPGLEQYIVLKSRSYVSAPEENVARCRSLVCRAAVCAGRGWLPAAYATTRERESSVMALAFVDPDSRIVTLAQGAETRRRLATDPGSIWRSLEPWSESRNPARIADMVCRLRNWARIRDGAH